MNNKNLYFLYLSGRCINRIFKSLGYKVVKNKVNDLALATNIFMAFFPSLQFSPVKATERLFNFMLIGI